MSSMIKSFRFSLINYFICHHDVQHERGSNYYTGRSSSSSFLCIFMHLIGYASVRPFSVLRPFSYIRRFLYFDLFTSTYLLRHFVKSGLRIGFLIEKYRSKFDRRTKFFVEVKFRSK